MFSSNALIAGLTALVAAAVILLSVERFNLGLKMGSWTNTAILVVAIALIVDLGSWILNIPPGGLAGALLVWIVAAGVLLAADRFIPRLQVKGVRGSVIAGAGVALLAWIFSWALSLFKIP